ncbi:cytochrome P450 [Actinomadura rubrisoli]|uniref:Cytochrome P450 n=1 Tax=Actinomadura rubrisoli TaxID=2530368 RepID=A0A4R5BR61_9ACTN|nr:cytochrome P450 [Actinomadura rubrisoli]TDD88026.1 cytochrome P450 [Actinomadura rubrisoli]
MTTRWPSLVEFRRERLDLDPEYARLRAKAPVTRITLADGGRAWLVTGWEEARQVYSDPRFSRALAVADGEPTFIIDMDPPEHTRVRRTVAGAFTHRRVERMRPRVRELTAGLLDGMAAGGEPADPVQRLSLPLPVTVICELLGVPIEDRERFQSWSEAFLSVTAHTPEQIQDARRNLDGYLAGLIERRRAEPAADLLSALAGEDGLSERELVHLGVALLVAGHESTASQITNFAYTLLSRPERWRRLAGDPDLLPAAIEELLRYTPLGSETGLPRIAAQDVTLGGAAIGAGDTVLVARPAASRDPAVFADPDDLVLDRADNPHLAFGHGLHHCVGAHLARLELRAAFGGLLERFPGLRIAVPEAELRWKTGLVMRGPTALPVAWTAP